MSINKATLIGRLGKDPEIRYFNNGDAVANFSLATTEKWKDKQGQTQEHTEWHNVIFFRKLAEVCQKYLHKGDLLYVEGKIRTEKYQAQDGTNRYTTKIYGDTMQMLGSKSDSAQAGENTPQNAKPQAQAQNNATPQPIYSAEEMQSFDDDIPF